MPNPIRMPNACPRVSYEVGNVGEQVKLNHLSRYLSYVPSGAWWKEFSQCALWDCGHINWGKNLGVNEEEQRYIREGDLPDEYFPFSMHEGAARITARKVPEELQDRNIIVRNDGKLYKQPWASGIVTTRYDSQFNRMAGISHGRIEVEARANCNPSDFPAIWLVKSQLFDDWEEEFIPEIDIMEMHGHNPFAFHTTLHAMEMDQLVTSGRDHTLANSLDASFNTFGVTISPESITWDINRTIVFKECTPIQMQHNDLSLTLVINLAIGGGWNKWQRNHDASLGLVPKRAHDEPESHFDFRSIKLWSWV